MSYPKRILLCFLCSCDLKAFNIKKSQVTSVPVNSITHAADAGRLLVLLLAGQQSRGVILEPAPTPPPPPCNSGWEASAGSGGLSGDSVPSVPLRCFTSNSFLLRFNVHRNHLEMWSLASNPAGIVRTRVSARGGGVGGGRRRSCWLVGHAWSSRCPTEETTPC